MRLTAILALCAALMRRTEAGMPKLQTLTAENGFAHRSLSTATNTCFTTGCNECGKRDCVDTPTGFECTGCKDGYMESVGENGATFCEDIDECENTDKPVCDANAVCVDADPPQRYTCECEEGFTGSGYGKDTCDDIDECEDPNLNNCPDNSKCVNNPGSFTCMCLDGFTKDGEACVPTTPAPVMETEPTPPEPTDPRTFTLDFCPADQVEEIFLSEQFEGASTFGWMNGRLSTASGGSESFDGFTGFLGPFRNGDAFPVKTYQFTQPGVKQIFFAFQFIEGDSWDSNPGEGPDELLMEVSGDDGLTQILNLGTYDHNVNEGNNPVRKTEGLITWERVSDDPANIGGSNSFMDQVHTFSVAIPDDFYRDTKDFTVRFMWNLRGNNDEFVGFDNIRIVFCSDFTPSASPSQSPVNPTPEPTPSPTSPTTTPPETDAPTPMSPGETDAPTPTPPMTPMPVDEGEPEPTDAPAPPTDAPAPPTDAPAPPTDAPAPPTDAPAPPTDAPAPPTDAPAPPTDAPAPPTDAPAGPVCSNGVDRVEIDLSECVPSLRNEATSSFCSLPGINLQINVRTNGGVATRFRINGDGDYRFRAGANVNESHKLVDGVKPAYPDQFSTLEFVFGVEVTDLMLLVGDIDSGGNAANVVRVSLFDSKGAVGGTYTASKDIAVVSQGSAAFAYQPNRRRGTTDPGMDASLKVTRSGLTKRIEIDHTVFVFESRFEDGRQFLRDLYPALVFSVCPEEVYYYGKAGKD